MKGVKPMSDIINPFEQAMSMAGSTADPFANAASDPFASALPAKEAAPQLNLGSQQTAPNPFETPAKPPAEPPAGPPAEKPAIAQDPATQTAPIINLGSQPDAAMPFSEQESPVPAKEISGGPLTLLQREDDDDDDDDDDAEEEDPDPDSEEIENPIAAAMAEQDKTQQQSIFAKPPIFEHGAVKEPIEDPEQTFEDLRTAKADDFPELEDGVRVSWNVTYGKIQKSVPTPKKTKIGEFKKSIETSKEFIDALKKDKNKSPDCIIKPRVTAQSKGDKLPLPSYKGVFTNLRDAKASGKVITIVPGRDGKVYEIRREEAGTFITPSGECGELSSIEAGFVPALPKIPRWHLLEILGFFRSLMLDGHNYEAIANIYWDRERKVFITVIPKQRVTATRADSELNDEYDPARYIHYMDVHSHNIMAAVFSLQDDRDEKATRLYAVIGKLNRYIPEMSLRLSNGGKFLAIDPLIVFESLDDFYPASWHEHIETSAGIGAREGNSVRNCTRRLDKVRAS